MKSRTSRLLYLSALILLFGLAGGAQERTARAPDPRVGLKAGLRDAGTAARNMELVSSLPKPDGFFDPDAPGGRSYTAGARRQRTATAAWNASAAAAARF